MRTIDLAQQFKSWCVSTDKRDMPGYFSILSSALESVDPCYTHDYYFDRYMDIGSNRTNFAIQQINSAVEEAAGSSRLLELIKEIPDNEYNLEEKFLHHSKEEAYHFTLFVNMFTLLFPDITVSEELKAGLESCFPSVPDIIEKSINRVPYERVYEELAQINAGEMRNLVQLKLTKPILIGYAQSRLVTREIERIMDRLISDEFGHIYYTARLIEDHIEDQNAGNIADLYEIALSLFDKEAKIFMWPY
jgi:hypothetical protein